ncbi:MAG: hypothetical protein GC155_15645 [Alphaproteobacteria bacterium]|nr:hypothetical protein [Alphaproteobacteria bacterium]
MHWHTVRYDEKSKTVEVYRHDRDFDDGEPLILVEAGLDKFGQSMAAADQLAGWLGRILLVDNPEVRKALGLN